MPAVLDSHIIIFSWISSRCWSCTTRTPHSLRYTEKKRERERKSGSDCRADLFGGVMEKGDYSSYKGFVIPCHSQSIKTKDYHVSRFISQSTWCNRLFIRWYSFDWIYRSLIVYVYEKREIDWKKRVVTPDFDQEIFASVGDNRLPAVTELSLPSLAGTMRSGWSIQKIGRPEMFKTKK